MAIYRVTSSPTWRYAPLMSDEDFENHYVDSLPWRLAYVVVNDIEDDEEAEICFLANRYRLLGVLRNKEIVNKLCGISGVLLAPLRKDYIFDPKYVVYPDIDSSDILLQRGWWGGSTPPKEEGSDPLLQPKKVVKQISVIHELEEHASPCRVCVNQIPKLGGACSLGQLSCHQFFKLKKGESDYRKI